RNALPSRPSTKATSPTGNMAKATSSGPASPLAVVVDEELPSRNAANHTGSGGSPVLTITLPSARATTAAQSAAKSRWASAVRTSRRSTTSVCSTSTAAVSNASRRGSGSGPSTDRTSSTSTPSTSPTSCTSSGTRRSSGSSTASSSMARPPPVSRMSMPTRSPRTAPMRLATAPRAPGRSGNQTRRTKVGTRPSYDANVNTKFPRCYLCLPAALAAEGGHSGWPHAGEAGIPGRGVRGEGALAPPPELGGFPDVGDAVDADEAVVAVDEDPELELAGEHELAVVDARAVDPRGAHAPSLHLVQFCPTVPGRRGLPLVANGLTVRSVPRTTRSMGRWTLSRRRL